MLQLRRPIYRKLTIVAAGLTAATLCACGTGSSGPTAGSPATVSVSVSACGQGWTSGHAGHVTMRVHNTDTRAGEVDLIDTSGAVYAEMEPLAAGTTRDLHADLKAGKYALRCSMEDESSVTGATVTLTGSGGGTPGVQAVNESDLVPAVKAYERYVTDRLPALSRLATTLQRDITAGHLTAAQRDWLPVQLDYLRLGAAYGAFGDDDAKIDGRADGLPDGVHDSTWTGLHRIEYGLWHGQSATTLKPISAALVADIHNLTVHFGSAQIDPLDIGIRAHEITENAVEFSLTGRDDYGAHDDLDFLVADIHATQTVLSIVDTLLRPRYPALPHVDTQLRGAVRDIEADRGSSRALPPLDDLDHTARIRIDSDVSELAESLAPVASILEPRRTS